jgi:hypothetical protein
MFFNNTIANYQAVVGSAADPYPLATAFIAASGVTGSSIVTALQNLETDLNTYGLTSKMIALYPLVGGTIGTVKYNFMNPADTDAAFRLTVVGNVNIASNGISGSNYDLGAGFNNGFNTNMTPSVDLTNNDNHMCFYSRTNPSQDAFNPILYPTEMGADTQDTGGPTGVRQLQLAAKYYANNICIAINLREGAGSAQFFQGDPRGLYVNTRRSSTDLYLYKNLSGTVTTATDTAANGRTLSGYTNPITLTTIGGATSNRQLAFASIGYGLSNTQVTDLYTTVQAFQTTLGRQV